MEERTNEVLLDELMAILPTGQQNAIHLSEICEKLYISDTAAKKLIHNARKIFVIISGKKGYYLAETNEEKEKFVKFMSRAAVSRLASIRTTRLSLQDVPGQMDLFEGVADDG